MSEVQDLFPAMRPVKLETIETELDTMWRETNTQMAVTGGHAFSRNSVLTLVVCTQTLERARHVIAAVHDMTTQHPSRAIVVAADPTQIGRDIQAYVGTYVGADSASYGEDIVLVAQSDAIRHLPGVVLPLIISGLPSFLWWTGEPPWGSEQLEALVDGSDRFIVDTSEMTHVRTSLLAMGDLLRRKKSRCAISDMSWTYQSPWREIVAQFFDPPQARQYLDAIERITIDYAASDEDSHVNVSQAYLFAGWLSSRLGWSVDQIPYGSLDPSRVFTLKNATGRRISMEINARFGIPEGSWWDTEPAGHVPAALASRDSAQQRTGGSAWVRPGGLMSVHIAARASANGPRATFAVARERDLAHATTLSQMPEGAAPSQTVHLQSIGEQAPLAIELQALGHDSVYEDALAASASFVGTMRRSGV